MLMITACEKSEMQKSSAISSKEIKSRSCPTTDCDDCDPVEDCCCSVTLLDVPDGPLYLEFCGTSGPCLSTTACNDEDPGICGDINGFIENITLPSQFSTALFCVAKNSPFAIKSSTQALNVRLTCQVGQATPSTVTIKLNTAPNKPYWETDGDCELTPCF
jgi:hypothetical protein